MTWKHALNTYFIFLVCSNKYLLINKTISIPNTMERMRCEMLNISKMYTFTGINFENIMIPKKASSDVKHEMLRHEILQKYTKY